MDFGIYLQAGSDEILVPKRYVPEGTQIGDYLDVFLYRDSEDRIIATTLIPKVMVGGFAYLEVVETNKYGVFVDWGLPKDLFVPFQEQNGRMVPGKKYVIRAYIDEETDRIVGSARIEHFLQGHVGDLKEGQEIEILPFKYTDLGIKCIINGNYEGMLFRNMIYGTINLGQNYKAYIKTIRNDHKIDISLKPQIAVIEHLSLIQQQILKRLGQSVDYFLPLHDKSSPEEIYQEFQISKRDFKQAIGGLYKLDKIKISETGITLNS